MMTVCARGHMYKDTFLHCPTCTEERGDEELCRIQVEFLRRVANAEFSYGLRVCKSVKGGQRHVMMFSSWVRTFCMRTLPEKPSITYEPYCDETLARVCTGCRIEIRRLMKEATVE